MKVKKDIDDNKMDLFPAELSETIREGLNHGVSDELMLKGMISVGNLLGKFVKPDSPEEAIIQEVWDNATEDEKYIIAGVVLRMGKKRLH